MMAVSTIDNYDFIKILGKGGLQEEREIARTLEKHGSDSLLATVPPVMGRDFFLQYDLFKSNKCFSHFGSGNFGEVKLAKHKELEEIVAIKFLRRYV